MAQERNLTPPAGLKPVEQEAWLAMARRQGASGGNELASFYPKRYGEPFVVEGEGVRVALSPETTVHYDFTTTGVPDSTRGLNLLEH